MGVTQPEPYLAGMFTELRCNVSLSNAVDSPVDVSVIWQKDGRVINEAVRVRVVPPRLVGGSRYESLLQYNTLSSNTDSGNYMCISTVYPTQNSNYIRNNTESAAISITVAGIGKCMAVSIDL